ncbi:MAG: carbon-nitrogen hydrolase family protein [Lentisphaeria bacterium]|nr:carbon-nitrogen hydrolase family protein [Lentisphaeria bacterium]
MSRELRVAAFQMSVSLDVAENVAKLKAAIDKAAEDGAEILLSPEGSLSGYTHEFDAADVEEALATITDYAKEKGIGLALGTCFIETDGLCYNQLRFYKPDGEYLGFHSKTLCCGTMEKEPQGEVQHYAVKPLEVFQWRDDLCIGGLISNDLWANPVGTPMPDTHLTHQLSEMGAEIIFHAVNGGRSDGEWAEVNWQFHESNLRLRAKSGKLWVLTADNANPVTLPCSAPTALIDPSGNIVCQAEKSGEHLIVDTVNF